MSTAARWPAAGLGLLAGLSLAACATPEPPPAAVAAPAVPSTLDGGYGLECAPFARALSGVQLTGNAADWWWKADGRYGRSNTPEVGAVLVFGRSARLANGHVAVVSQQIAAREIRVTHANWVRYAIAADQPVIDVSADNDWTLVRVWWPPAGQLGATAYPTEGFILPDQPASPDQLAAAVPAAIERAQGWR